MNVMLGSCLSIKIFCKLKCTYCDQYKSSCTCIKWNQFKDVKGCVDPTSLKYVKVTPPLHCLNSLCGIKKEKKEKRKKWDTGITKEEYYEFPCG